jgi:Mg-chelatase subunit ChlD
MESLGNRDYVLVIDKSGSMSDSDTPTGQTRWEYAQESTVAIAREVCSKYDKDGITLIPFAGSFKVHENVTESKVKDAFKEHSPMGGTILAPVLKNAFDSYLKRKAAGQTKPNGEMLIVVTDGQPQDEAEVAKTIVQFGNKLDNADEEYGIQFIQIGKDAQASKFLKKLDDDLVSQGAKYDIVDTKTMEEVESIGLTETLIAALND